MCEYNKNLLCNNESPYFYINKIKYCKNWLDSISMSEFTENYYRLGPDKLYKYYSNRNDKNNINYSIKNLENNTIYMQDAINFDDPYDTMFYVNEDYFFNYCLNYYSKLCGLKLDISKSYWEKVYDLASYIYENLLLGKALKEIFFIKDNDNDINDIRANLFTYKIENYLKDNINKHDVWNRAIHEVILNNYKDINNIKSYFQISCFTTNKYSIPMWAHYADMHRGFCIEYSIKFDYSKYSELLYNLFQVIYSNQRIDITNSCINFFESNPSQEDLWNIYKYALLSKSLDWQYQNEWRIIFYKNNLPKDHTNSIPFFPISKVYLGCKMPNEEREKIKQICKNRNIPVTDMFMDVQNFSIKECLCDCDNCDYKINCPNFISMKLNNIIN